MNKLQRQSYQAPELAKIKLDNDLSVLLSFSIEGGIVDDITEGVEDNSPTPNW